jgi:hydrogenase nickel incorporation protein HypA/HybF
MHELALVESLVETVSATLPDETLTVIRVEVGGLVAVVPDAMRFCFDVCTRGTRLEGVRLDIIEVPGRGQCLACGAEFELTHFPLCACGSADVHVRSGNELRVKDVEVLSRQTEPRP